MSEASPQASRADESVLTTSARSRMPTRLLLGLIGLILLVTLTVRGVTSIVTRLERPYDRLEGVLHAGIPTAKAQAGSRVVFFGASGVLLGFSPAAFDRTLHDKDPARAPTTSFNFSWPGIMADSLWGLAKHYRRAMEGADTSKDLILVEWSPDLSTEKSMSSFLVASNLSVKSRILDWELWKDTASRSTTDGMTLFGLWLTGATRKNAMLEWVTLQIFGPRKEALWWFSRMKEDPVVLEEIATRAERIGWLERIRRAEGWLPSTRGARWFAPETEEEKRVDAQLWALWYSPIMDVLGAKKWQQMDWLGLHIHPRAVEHFIRAVREFQKVSRNVVVVIFPRRQDYILEPGAHGRVEEAVARIRKDTGVEVLNFQSLWDTKENFADPLHLNPVGSDRFSAVLAERVAPYLDARRPRLP